MRRRSGWRASHSLWTGGSLKAAFQSHPAATLNTYGRSVIRLHNSFYLLFYIMSENRENQQPRSAEKVPPEQTPETRRNGAPEPAPSPAPPAKDKDERRPKPPRKSGPSVIIAPSSGPGSDVVAVP